MWILTFISAHESILAASTPVPVSNPNENQTAPDSTLSILRENPLSDSTENSTKTFYSFVLLLLT